MTAPHIAAVIPAFNSANSIAAAIASARQQIHPPDEIIVVDDGSGDDTARIAETAGARVLRQPNGGPGAARNAGIAATTAEWIALLDADDTWRPERLARQLPLTIDAAVGLVFAGHAVPGKTPPLPPPTMAFDQLWRRNQIPTSSVLLRRSAWEQLGGFHEGRELIGVEDYNLWLRMAHAGWLLRCVQERLVDYVPTSASLTSQTRRFATAELAQLGVIARQIGLDAQLVQRKEYRLYLDYGQEMFYYRQLSDAREFLREAGRRGTLPPKARLQMLASYLPLPERTVG